MRQHATSLPHFLRVVAFAAFGGALRFADAFESFAFAGDFGNVLQQKQKV